MIFIFNLLFRRKKPSEKVKPKFSSQLPVDFEKDVAFLMFLVQSEMQYFEYRGRLIGRKTINDNECLEGIAKISESVLNSVLTTPYREDILMRYFTEDSLDDFVVKVVTAKVVEYGMKINRNTLAVERSK
jgi:hypothetical protein